MALPIPLATAGIIPAVVFQLGQAWLPAPEAGFQPAEVRVSWSSETLYISAHLTDDDIVSTATGDNQHLWKLGDVFEVFLQIEGEKDYVELHVEPNNYRMLARYPGPSGSSFEDKLISPIPFHSSTSRTDKGWNATMTIPARLLRLDQFREGQKLRISCCRYDVSGNPKRSGIPTPQGVVKKQETVLSSSSSHPVPKFHRPEDWRVIVLTPP